VGTTRAASYSIEAPLAETFLLGDCANRLNLSVGIVGNELVVSTHVRLDVNTVVGVPESANALFYYALAVHINLGVGAELCQEE
jgi:hypothetical protein